MARHRRMVAPINSIKHLIHLNGATILTGTVLRQIIIDSVVAPAAAAATNVTQGSIIKAVYVEMWIGANGVSGTSSIFNMNIEKQSGDMSAQTFAESSNLSSYDNKKNILYITQGILGTFKDGNQIVPAIRQWFAIPKGKQRFGLGDSLVLNISALASTDLVACGMFVYKEYR